MNRRRYDNSERFDRTSRDDYRGRYQNSSKFDDSKYSSSFRHSYKNSSNRNEDYRNDRYRNDDSRSSHRRNDVRPKTPPPPSFRSSRSNHTRGSSHRNYDSTRHTSSYKNSYSPPRRRQNEHFNGTRGTTQRYNPRLRAPARRDSDVRPRLIRRKVIMSSTRKFNSLRDRTRMIRLAKLRKARDSLKSKTKKSTKEDDSDDDEKDAKKSEDTEEKSTKEKKADADKDEDCEDDGDDKKEGEENSSKDEEKPKRRSTKRESATPERKPKTFIKLICVHCKTKCRTFNTYQHHLHQKTHRMAMRRVGIRQKSKLSKMRLEQRNAQKELEENTKDELGDQQYCLLCRLNYKTGKAKHQLSEHHKTMKKFLMPYCSTCHIAFKSPTVYQSHRSSLDHIKRKARDNKSDSENSDEEMEVDLKDFTTVDSIGASDDDSGDEVDTSQLDDESLGLNSVRKVEALYCDTCENYISNDITNEEEQTLEHCKTKLHVKLIRKAAAKARAEEMAAEEAEANDESKVEDDAKDETIEDEDIEAEPTAEENNDDAEDNNDAEDNDDDNDGAILDIDISNEKNDNDLNDEAANTDED